LIGGVVVTESVFNIPGLGRLVVEAIQAKDFTIIQGLIVLFTVVDITVNLIIDILYTIVDPRIES
ncbi:MAG TPA: ABC transporter permease subunit, partial [Burkholderiaceae bacterium]|nr:ABC transporter permease subunit [Burkholderiaceae bacterium]